MGLADKLNQTLPKESLADRLNSKPTTESTTSKDAQTPIPFTGTKEELTDLNQKYSSLDSMYKTLQPSIENITSPINAKDVYYDNTNTQKEASLKDVFGIELPKIERNTPYKSLIKANAKLSNLGKDKLEGNSLQHIYNQKTVERNTQQDLDFIKNANSDELSEFITNKKKDLQNKVSIESEFGINKPISKEGSLLSDYITNKVNLNSEYNTIQYDLNKIAQENAFVKSPILSNNIEESLKLPTDKILEATEQVGNNIVNAGDNINRVNFKATSQLDEAHGGYSKLYKDNLRYTGIQAEIANTYKLLDKDNKLVSEKLNEVKDLTLQLNQDPTNKDLISQVRAKIVEIKPIEQSITNKKAFIGKLNEATFDLPEISKQIERQKQADKDWEEYYNSSIISLPTLGYIGKGISNSLINTLKSSALIGNQLAKSLGTKSESETARISSNLLSDNTEFTLPKKYSMNEVFTEDKNATLGFDINWHIALPMTADQTIRTLMMGSVASKFPTNLAGKIAGLYAGSALVYGGDILKGELQKGLTFSDALAITNGRLLIEAGTELINPLEFIPFNGIPKLLGKYGKDDFIRYVGDNWKTLLPKLKAQGVNLATFLTETGKQAGMESFEEIMSDLGNYGLDKYVLNNIKSDYSQDNQFDIDNEINTFFSTALTMLPMAVYGGYGMTKEKNSAPNLRWQAAQMPKTFLDNLDENLKKGNITKEFYDSGKKEVETISNLYNNNKLKIDNVEENKRAEYLNSIYELDKLQKQLPSETDQTKSEKLAKDIEKALLKVNSFDKDAISNLNLSPIQKQEKVEERHIENIQELASTENIKTSPINVLEKAKIELQKVVDSPVSEKVGKEALSKIEEINNEITSRKEKEEQISKQTPLQQEQERLNTLSKEELEAYNPLLNKELSKADKSKLLNQKLERQQALQDQEDTIALGDKTFKVGDQVTTDGGKTYWYVQGKGEKGIKLSREFDNTAETTEISDANDITPYTETKTKQEEPTNLTSQTILEQAFGKQEETPSEDIEAKKADIERRRQEELSENSVDAILKPGAGKGVKVGQKYNDGFKVIVETAIEDDSYNAETDGDGYLVYSRIISDAEFDESGKMTKAPIVETTRFKNEETADKKLQERYTRLSEKEKQGSKKRDSINAKYDAELAELEKEK